MSTTMIVTTNTSTVRLYNTNTLTFSELLTIGGNLTDADSGPDGLVYVASESGTYGSYQIGIEGGLKAQWSIKNNGTTIAVVVALSMTTLLNS